MQIFGLAVALVLTLQHLIYFYGTVSHTIFRIDFIKIDRMTFLKYHPDDPLVMCI